jgi:hypothetical protein
MLQKSARKSILFVKFLPVFYLKKCAQYTTSTTRKICVDTFVAAFWDSQPGWLIPAIIYALFTTILAWA